MFLWARLGQLVDERTTAVRHGPFVGGTGDRHDLGLRGEVDQRGAGLRLGGGEPRCSEIEVEGRDPETALGGQVDDDVRRGRLSFNGHESHAGASRESDDGSGQARQVRTAVAARDDRRVELVWLAGRTGGPEVVGQGVKERGVSGVVDVDEVAVDRGELSADAQCFDVHRRGPRVDDQFSHEMASQCGAAIAVTGERHRTEFLEVEQDERSVVGLPDADQHRVRRQRIWGRSRDLVDRELPCNAFPSPWPGEFSRLRERQHDPAR